MAKIIVTHYGPDIDAIAAVWLVQRFFLGWEKASYGFVSAGETFRGAPADGDPEIIHVDTGLGKYDHHQDHVKSSATQKVFEEIKKNYRLEKNKLEALERLVGVINEIDNGRDISWAEASTDRSEFLPQAFLNYFENGEKTDEEKIKLGGKILEMIYLAFRSKVEAEKDLGKGQNFKTRWGKGVLVETENDNVLIIGEKKGYSLVAKKSPSSGHLRVYSRWDRDVDLTKAYEMISKKDPNATWYLHPSKCLLLNGSRKNPKTVPTVLSAKEIISILKKA